MIQKFISNLSGKEKKILYVTIVFVFLAFFDRLFMGPVLEKLSNIDDEISLQEESIVRDLRFLNYKDRIIKEEEIFSIYANPEYSISLADIIPYVAFSYVLYGFYIIMLPGVFFREKTIFLPLATFAGAVLNVILNILFKGLSAGIR